MRRPLPLLIALACLLATSARAQTHPNLERGMNVGKSYQIGDIDSVSLFNGSHSIAIPLGQTYSAGGDLSYSFVLRYNSNVWDFSVVTIENDCIPGGSEVKVTLAEPQSTHNAYEAGLGWSVSFGTLQFRDAVPYDKYTYVSPDGSTHPFYPTMHDDEVPSNPVGKVFGYTRDGSYMRLEASNLDGSCSTRPNGMLEVKVEFADGRWQQFSRYDNCSDFFLQSEHDRFGNSFEFSYDQVNSRSVIRDSQGREHYIKRTRLGTEPPDSRTYSVIEYIDLAAFGYPPTAANGEVRARYTFTYDDTRNIARSCKHLHDFGYPQCNPEPADIDVVFLTAVTQPDGSTWTMLAADGTTPGYNLDPVSACAPPPPAQPIPRDRPGTITNLKAPTGGTYAWTYDTWRNPEGGANCYSSDQELDNVKDATGVATRVLDDPLTDTSGEWAYTHDAGHLPSGKVDPAGQESWTVVTTPQADQSKNYFRTQFCSAAAFVGWDYGLPYTRGRDGEVPEPGPFVSVEQFDGVASDRANLKRTSYLRYGKDDLDPAWASSALQQSNRRVELEQTVFADDANHYTTTSHYDFDGLGHFRTTYTAGDFGSGDVRHTTTNYNPGKHYPPEETTSEWWPHYLPWVINTYTSSRVSEGGQVAASEACFEANTGYLLRTRTLRLGATEPANPDRDVADVIVRRTHTGGDTTREEWFGGDTLPVNTDALCDLDLELSTAGYRLDHEYPELVDTVWNPHRRSHYTTSSGASLSFYTVDHDIDQSTGLAATSRDPAGLSTSFTYDLMGRMTLALPQSGTGAKVSYTYAPYGPSHTTGADVLSVALSNPGDQVLAKSQVVVDGFGRVRKERALLPGTTERWSQRLTTYDGMGRTETVSEWQPDGTSGTDVRKTVYSGFDLFGRVGAITRPDDTVTTMAYTGVRETQRTVRVGSLNEQSTTTESHDRHGRLISVTEPAGDDGGDVTTEYSYDVGNRLKRVFMNDAQERLFTYDNRGFLASEKLPEVGDDGNGTITYPKYDARGHATCKFDGEHWLLFTYDQAERLTQVDDAVADCSAVVATNNPRRKFAFATDNAGSNLKAGKLEWAEAINPSVRMGDPEFDTGQVKVKETYTYEGIGGRVSAKQTDVTVTDSDIASGNFSETFTLGFTYDGLGQILSAAYPRCTGAGCVSVAPERTVYNGYSNGYLTSVGPYYATGLTYLDSGMVGQVTHGKRAFDLTDGVADLVAIDTATAMARPLRIYTASAIVPGSGAVGDWSSGIYAYDGVGNITGMLHQFGSDIDPLKPAADTFEYDKVSRLTSAAVSQGETSRSESYGYDVYGNMTSYGAALHPIRGTTNRLDDAEYDAAGNLTSWPPDILTPTPTFSYDALNQMASRTVPGINSSFAYTADGERVLVRDGSTFTLTLRDLSGHVLREMTRTGGAWQWKKDYVYRGGSLLASVDREDGLRHYHLDHLGSPRMATNRCGERFRLYTTMPFGTEFALPQDDERMRFTVHERDLGSLESSADDMDYMHARSYPPTLARFTSVDPVRGKPQSPQSHNLYAYGLGNPVRNLDPNGRAVEAAGVVATLASQRGLRGIGGGAVMKILVDSYYYRQRAKEAGKPVSFWDSVKAVGPGSAVKGAAIGGANAFGIGPGATAAAIVDLRDQVKGGAKPMEAVEHSAVAGIGAVAGGLVGSLLDKTNGAQTALSIVASKVASEALKFLGNDLPQQLEPPDGSDQNLKDQKDQAEKLRE